jgi:hypothetical protein
MATKSDFNGEEWERVAQAPAFAALMVILADRGGTIRESLALGRAYAEARREGGGELIEALVSAPPTLSPSDMGSRDELRTQLPERIAQAVRTVEEKGTSDEVEQYRDFILGVADAVARAHKEGGVLGIGGKPVSSEERAALDELAGTIGATAG